MATITTIKCCDALGILLDGLMQDKNASNDVCNKSNLHSVVAQL